MARCGHRNFSRRNENQDTPRFRTAKWVTNTRWCSTLCIGNVSGSVSYRSARSAYRRVRCVWIILAPRFVVVAYTKRVVHVKRMLTKFRTPIIQHTIQNHVNPAHSTYNSVAKAHPGSPTGDVRTMSTLLASLRLSSYWLGCTRTVADALVPPLLSEKHTTDGCSTTWSSSTRTRISSFLLQPRTVSPKYASIRTTLTCRRYTRSHT